jgi:hypothetical protein
MRMPVWTRSTTRVEGGFGGDVGRRAAGTEAIVPWYRGTCQRDALAGADGAARDRQLEVVDGEIREERSQFDEDRPRRELGLAAPAAGVAR